MQQGDKAENQHYVPRLLLRNFCNSREQLHVYDKWQGKVLPGPTHIKNVASERNFNVIEKDGERFNAEPAFTFLENSAATVIETLVVRESLALLTDKDRLVLAFFVACQFIRTRKTRDTIRLMQAAVADKLRKMGHDPEKVEGFPALDAAAIKEMALFMLKDLPQFADMILNKDWVLLKSPKETPFYISDNPIGLHNDNDMGPYGNLGLAVPGIQIYLPLSPRISLAMFCPTVLGEGHGIFENHRKDMERHRALALLGGTADLRLRSQFVVNEMNSFVEQHPTMKRSLETYDRSSTGEPLLQDAANMEFANYLQVRFSSRYVFSADADFELVERILHDHPDWKEGIKPRID